MWYFYKWNKLTTQCLICSLTLSNCTTKQIYYTSTSALQIRDTFRTHLIKNVSTCCHYDRDNSKSESVWKKKTWQIVWAVAQQGEDSKAWPADRTGKVKAKFARSLIRAWIHQEADSHNRQPGLKEHKQAAKGQKTRQVGWQDKKVWPLQWGWHSRGLLLKDRHTVLYIFGSRWGNWQKVRRWVQRSRKHYWTQLVDWRTERNWLKRIRIKRVYSERTYSRMNSERSSSIMKLPADMLFNLLEVNCWGRNIHHMYLLVHHFLFSSLAATFSKLLRVQAGCFST